jgi:HEPN domain-containing protein
MAFQHVDSLTEFTKTKMHFALALLGTLFALHPFVERLGDQGFVYLGWDLKIFSVYGTIAGLLALTVYFYALSLLSERGYSWMEKTGNYLYAIAIMVLPLYGGLYLSNLLADRVGEAHLAVTAPMAALGLGLLWLAVSLLLARRMRKRLGQQDATAKLRELAEQEIAALDRAKELFDGHHYDLSVIESWKAIGLRLRRVLLLRGATADGEGPDALLRAASRARVLSPAAQQMVQELRRQWEVAVSTDPLTREAAEKALGITRDVLATIPLHLPGARATAVA